MNPQQYLPSHPFTHTHAGSYMRWRLVHMSYIHAEIDRYNCMHMQSCSSGLIWRRSGVKDFFQSKRVLTSGTSLSSVMKTIRKLFELKAKEPHEHLGDDRPGRVSPSFFFFSPQLLLSLQAWENNKWRAEFVSARLRKIRYHVLLSVWCQALWVVPECLIPSRLRWRRQSEGGGVQPEFTSTARNQLSFPHLHQRCLSIYLLFCSLFSPPDFSSSCVTQCSPFRATSPFGVCYSAEPKPKPSSRGRPRPVPESHTDIQLDTLFASSSSRCQWICDQEHVFRSTSRWSRAISRVGGTNHEVSLRLLRCRLSHVTDLQGKRTSFVSCGWV